MQVMCALVIHHNRVQGQHSSGLMLLFWLGLVIYGSLKLRTYILIARDQVQIDGYSTCTTCSWFAFGRFPYFDPVLILSAVQFKPMNNHATSCYMETPAHVHAMCTS